MVLNLMKTTDLINRLANLAGQIEPPAGGTCADPDSPHLYPGHFFAWDELGQTTVN